MSVSIFEQASRQKVRFSGPQGTLSVEDLWDLPLTSTKSRANLDELAVQLHGELEQSGPRSFVGAANPASAVTQLKFDLVKYVIDVKMAENAAERTRRDSAARKQQLLELIERKETESLQNLSIEELRALAQAA